jgi:AraC-like DNA-binding protein
MRIKTLRRVRLPNQSIRIMRDILLEAGLDTDPVFDAADVGAEVVDVPGATVSGVQELAFQRAFVAATAGRHDLWIKAGWSYSLLTLGGVGLAAMTAQTIDSLHTTLDEFRDFTFGLDAAREVRNGVGVVVGHETVFREVPSDLHDFTVCRNLGRTIRVLSEVWLGETSPARMIEVPLPALSFDRHPVVGMPIKLGRSARWLWKPETASRELPGHNELLHRLYWEQCEDQASRLAGKITVGDQVRELLQASAPPAREIHSVAAELHVSVRTLQRMLRIEGLSYRDLQRGARERAAKQMLRSTDLGVGEIGRRLGYHDTTNFCAAFRVWTGITPTDWRYANATVYSAEQSA